MDKKDKFFQRKMEIDETTNNIKVVEVSAEKTEDTEILTEDYSEELLESIGVQIPMNWFVDEEEKKLDKKQKRLKRILNFSFLIVLIGVMAYTFYLDFFSTHQKLLTAEEIKSICTNSYKYLLYGLLCFFLCLLFKCLKTLTMCKSLTGKWNFFVCFKTTIVGQYYNHITPMALGEQPYMIYNFSKSGMSGGVSASIPIATVFLKQFAFAVLAILSIVLYLNNVLDVVGVFSELSSLLRLFLALAWVGIFVCMLTPSVILIFSLFPKLSTKIVKFAIRFVGKMGFIKDVDKTVNKALKNIAYNSKYLKEIGTKPITCLISLLLSFLEQLAVFSLPFFTLKAFGFEVANVNFLEEWILVIIVSLILYSAVSFIPTPGNSGAADISFYKLFEVSLAGGLAFTATIAWRTLCFYLFIFVGIIVKNIKKPTRN